MRWPLAMLGLAGLIGLALALGGIRSADAYQNGSSTLMLKLMPATDQLHVALDVMWIPGPASDHDGDVHTPSDVAGTYECGVASHRIVVDWGDSESDVAIIDDCVNVHNFFTHDYSDAGTYTVSAVIEHSYQGGTWHPEGDDTLIVPVADHDSPAGVSTAEAGQGRSGFSRTHADDAFPRTPGRNLP